MKLFCSVLFFVALLIPCALLAQETFPARVVGANVGFCQTCDPQIGGGAWYATAVTRGEHPTYSFSLVNIDKVTVNSLKPLNVQVMTSAETGVGQHIARFNRFDLFGLATAGVAVAATNTGASYGGGTLALMPLGRGWLLGGYLRVGKQTIAKEVGWKVGLTLALGSK